MTRVTTGMLVPALAAFFAFGVPFHEADGSKCSPRASSAGEDMPDWATLVDGVVVAEETGAEVMEELDVDGESLDLVEVLCWTKAESWFDVEVRYGVVSVWTKPGPLTDLRRDMRELVEAQEAFFERHREYAAGIGELESFEPEPRSTIDVVLRNGDWYASGRANGTGYVCRIVTRSGPGAPEAEKGRVPSCGSSRARGS